MNSSQFREYIIRPTLKYMGHWSESAEQLLLATAAHESRCGEYVHQINGCALGPFQCEPATHVDIWINYLSYRDAMRDVVYSMTAPSGRHPNEYPRDDQLIWNFAYATAICRVHYLRVPEPLPAPGDRDGMAEYWGKHYQTENDPVKKKQFAAAWDRYGVSA